MKIKTKLLKLQRNRENPIYTNLNREQLFKAYKDYGKISQDISIEAMRINDVSKKEVTSDQDIANVLMNEYKKRIDNHNDLKESSKDFPLNTSKNVFFSAKNKIVDQNILKAINTPPSFEDYKSQLKDSAHSSMPGPDGLNSIFYNAVNDNLLQIAYQARLDAEEEHEPNNITANNLTAFLFPIPKRSPSGNNLSWNKVVLPSQIRFISLINTDIKAWTRLLNKKLSSILSSITHHYCFSVPGKNLQQAVYIMRYIAKTPFINKKSKSVLLKLDFSNTFDLTSREHLLNHMESLIGTGWLNTQIKSTINNHQIAVKFGASTSKGICPKIGLLQGCPISAAAYTLYMNILALKMIRILNGVTIPGTSSKLKVLHYIDDMVLACDGPQDEHNAWKLLNSFQKSTGAKLNIDKTERLPIHLQHQSFSKQIRKSIRKKLESSQLYGLFPFGSTKSATNKSFIKIIKIINKQIERHPKNFLPLNRRVQVVNTIFTSKFIYSIPLIRISTHMLKMYATICRKFLWNSMVHVPIRLLYLPKQFGGLGLINLATLDFSLKLNFVLKLQNSIIIPEDVKNVVVKHYKSFFMKKIPSTLCKLLESEVVQSTNRIHHKDIAVLIAESQNNPLLPKVYNQLYRSLPLSDSLKSLWFKMLWGRLPTSFYLKHSRKLSLIDDRCILCSDQQAETWVHLFTQCETVTTFYKDLTNITSIPISPIDNVFNPLTWSKSNSSKILLYLIIIQAIWNTRNNIRFGDSLTALSMKEHLLKLIKLLPGDTQGTKSIISLPKGIHLLK